MGTSGKYGEYYDLIHQDKNYERERDFVEEVFRAFSPKSAKTILDTARATGGHVIPLASNGVMSQGSTPQRWQLN